MLLFIHTPKTAGTSFRKSAENYFGSSNTFYDYGEQSSATSPLIIETEYKNKDRYQLFKTLSHKPQNILCGHFPLNKYAPLYDAKNIISFVRKPEQQIRSHYEHYARHHNYKKSFIEFIKENRFINIQSRLLNGFPIQAIGFIGITEQYEASLQIINAEYQTKIQFTHINENQNKTNTYYEINNEELKLIKSLNEQDYTLYSEVEKILARKIIAIENNTPVYAGEINKNKSPNIKHLQINGWLTNFESDTPCHGKITINNANESNFIARDYRHWANERASIRKGYIGFSIKPTIPLQENDTVKLYAENGDLLDTYVI